MLKETTKQLFVVVQKHLDIQNAKDKTAEQKKQLEKELKQSLPYLEFKTSFSVVFVLLTLNQDSEEPETINFIEAQDLERVCEMQEHLFLAELQQEIKQMSKVFRLCLPRNASIEFLRVFVFAIQRSINNLKQFMDPLHKLQSLEDLMPKKASGNKPYEGLIEDSLTAEQQFSALVRTSAGYLVQFSSLQSTVKGNILRKNDWSDQIRTLLYFNRVVKFQQVCTFEKEWAALQSKTSPTEEEKKLIEELQRT